MSDGQPVFSAAHNNVGTPADISLDSLSEARTAMRRQTGPGGELLNVTPRFLVVTPEEETIAEQALAEIAAATAGEVNVFAEPAHAHRRSEALGRLVSSSPIRRASTGSNTPSSKAKAARRS